MEPDVMLHQLRETCRRLLTEGTVKVVVGYGQDAADEPAHAVFITRPDDVEQLVWNEHCAANLVKYLHFPEVRAMGKAAIVVKGCDQRALVALAKESQIERDEVYAIGMACSGMGNPRARKCETCDVHLPLHTDTTLGEAENPSLPMQTRYADLEALLRLPAAERMAFWRGEFARCVKCYACRQVCPMCYCRRCIVEKNRPTAIDTSATLKGNFAWHITRAFHLAGRCVGCYACVRACPAGIDLRLLNQSLARAAETAFSFSAGMDAEAEPILGSYSQNDAEDFIQ
jgi:ferredoxin